MESTQRGRPKSRIGLVTSDKMQKTVVIEVLRRVRHPKYGKYQTRRVKLKAHDENNEAKVGDSVRVVETRPLSKDKRWRVAEITAKARQA